MAQQTETAEFQCDICGAEYDSITDLERHKHEHARIARTEEEDQQTIHRDIGAAGMPTSPLS
ncbi:MAG: hypothetical protein Q8922_02770 [Bacteroidota bacterium]|nr:hypothetical protein [Bacteroidota bacterium]MDP4232889.1 hypothetical protein [Bacteroidota bacterium]MDP4241933.1 hypothetical protein [Bacteroidota bacterium]MDP4286836.1 hypothetical protein [Bacteroidota bacterium]